MRNNLLITYVTELVSKRQLLKRVDNRIGVIVVKFMYRNLGRSLCPNCHMKTNCCDGAPCEIVEVKTTTSELNIT